MAEQKTPPRRVRVLPAEVARKIAAGEVIDRPFSVVRELLDNAIDAGARSIELHIEQGGTKSIRCVDDGHGMSRSDLELCYLPHATSKIESERDLEHLGSLGFRGEALSSIGAVSRLKISTVPGEADEGGLLEVQDGRKLALRPTSGKQGTVVEVRDLFFSLPGRKRFLKQPAAETSMCRNVLTEKAIAHPGVGFRLFTDGSLRLSLPPASRKERILAAAEGKIEASLVDEISGSGPSFTVEALLARPEARRKDRKFLQVFVNGRRLWDYALLQAIEYGYGGYVPGGLHPVAFVFLQVDPALVDFNIHPAKKEARFRNMGELHHRIVTLVQSHLRSASLQRMVSDRRTPAAELPGFRDAPAKSPSDRWRSPLNVDRHASVASPAPSDSARRAWLPPESGGPSRPQTHSFRGPVEQTGETATPYGGAGDSELTYFGQLFGVFLLASFRGEFFIVDQHAAHERLIYDKLRSRPGVQELLVPLEFELDEDAAAFARSKRESFEHLGISIEEHNAEENAETGSFRITRIPEAFLGAEGSLISAIASLSATEQGLEEELYARTACRSAVMDGDRVDELTAMHILRGTFALDNPRCPHGRPVFHKLTRPELFKLVERT